MADTIAAIATGGVLSAIGIIRLSGDDALKIAEKVFKPFNGIKMSSAEDRKLYYGNFLDEDGSVLDVCLCTISRRPKSYTGEDTAEFQCHGSPVVLRAGLNTLFKAGARQALAGEFTKRAFLNGCMDLTQAEAVIDLIDAETSAAAKNAASQLGRAISRKTDRIYDELLNIMSHFHAVIDYPDEDIDDFQLEGYIAVLNSAEKELAALLNSFERGKIMTQGIKSVIIGRPNAGKSSLMNTLLGYDRAIVTDIAGTTRDIIEEKIKLGNVILRLTDTAGIRETDDIVEKIGVERTNAAADEAGLVIAVFDGSEELFDEDRKVIEKAKKAPKAIAVLNKSDLPQKTDADVLRNEIENVCVISAETGAGIEELCRVAEKMFDADENIPTGEIITNQRQAENVAKALESIKDGKEAMQAGITPDAVLTSVEDALSALGDLTGKTMREDVVSRIFERFCVGK